MAFTNFDMIVECVISLNDTSLNDLKNLLDNFEVFSNQFMISGICLASFLNTTVLTLSSIV